MTRNRALVLAMTMLLLVGAARAITVAEHADPQEPDRADPATAAAASDWPVKESLILGCGWAALVGAACLAPFLRRRHRIVGIVTIMCLAVNLVLLLGVAGVGQAPAATMEKAQPPAAAAEPGET